MVYFYAFLIFIVRNCAHFAIICIYFNLEIENSSGYDAIIIENNDVALTVYYFC